MSFYIKIYDQPFKHLSGEHLIQMSITRLHIQRGILQISWNIFGPVYIMNTKMKYKTKKG